MLISRSIRNLDCTQFNEQTLNCITPRSYKVIHARLVKQALRRNIAASRMVLPEGRAIPWNGERSNTNSIVERHMTMMNDPGRTRPEQSPFRNNTPINLSMRISILIAHVGVLQLFRCNLASAGIATSLPAGTKKRINKLGNGRALMNRSISNRQWDDDVGEENFRRECVG